MENKMTIEELLKIIKQKRENAKNDLIYLNNVKQKGYGLEDLFKEPKLQGEINAYTDLICLIESKMGKE